MLNYQRVSKRAKNLGSYDHNPFSWLCLKMGIRMIIRFPLRIAIVGVTKGIQSHFQTPFFRLWLVKNFPFDPHSIPWKFHTVDFPKNRHGPFPRKSYGLDPVRFLHPDPLNRSGRIVMEPPTATSSSDHRKRSKPPSAAWSEQESDIAN